MEMNPKREISVPYLALEDSLWPDDLVEDVFAHV